LDVDLHFAVEAHLGHEVAAKKVLAVHEIAVPGALAQNRAGGVITTATGQRQCECTHYESEHGAGSIGRSYADANRSRASSRAGPAGAAANVRAHASRALRRNPDRSQTSARLRSVSQLGRSTVAARSSSGTASRPRPAAAYTTPSQPETAG